MKTRLSIILVGAVLVTLPRGALAQDMPRLGELSAASVWHVDPADMETFMTVAQKVAEAAKQAKLGPEYAWTMWQSSYRISIIGPFNKAELDDPEIWMKQFMGTPGEATLMQAMQEFEGVNILGGVSEIVQEMPDWGYMPEGMTMPPMAWVHIHEFWLKSGQANFAKWNALIPEFVSFFRDIGYPYPMWSHLVRYGDNRTLFVTAYDDMGEFFGPKSVTALAQKHGMADRWMQLLTRLNELVIDHRESDAQFLAAQSYMAEQ
ncbi:MAG: hypothetical protein GTN62_07395 [Gemmatimonadales bacterium]|nr:hypothetical protein [Gemmatimonadales bacterium]NIN49924.1 hypothetical protein [Gemmatimonadales bacterium]NIP07388.1 hypothetical protein [Gemmatimonadales bacterium]NIS65610.1 hypothetical protein [Gemmatimonadales bacterium]